MPSVAVASQKGGVGKTTLALNLAYALARRGLRTLVVDTDPQGAVGLSVAGAGRRSSGLVGCLAGGAKLSEATLATNLGTLFLLPTAAEDALALGIDPVAVMADAPAVKRLLAEAAAAYDFVLVDTASGLSGPTRTVLESVDYVLVPIQAEPLALRSVPQLLHGLGALREAGARAQLLGFVITMLNSKSDVSLSVAQESWSSLPLELVLHSYVPRDAAFLRASAHGVPLHLLSRRAPPVAAVFDQIAAEVEERAGFTTQESEDEPIPLLV